MRLLGEEEKVSDTDMDTDMAGLPSQNAVPLKSGGGQILVNPPASFFCISE